MVHVRDILLIKHAVGGRVIVDTRITSVPWKFEADPDGGGQFTVTIRDKETGHEAVRLAYELNVFIFRQADDQIVSKIWHYVDGKTVHYDENSGELRFAVRKSIQYTDEKIPKNST